jgi:hypothetical protein
MTLCLREHDLDWRELDDEIVALDGCQGEYLSVRGAGAVVWRLLAGTAEREHLVEALVERYGIDAEVAAVDVDAFLSSLDERGLLAS